MKPVIERRRYGPVRVHALDSERIRQRRIAAELGVQELADVVAASSTQTIWRLEHDSDQGQLSLAFVARIAEALGTTIGELLVEGQQPDSEPDDDAAAVGALLASAERWCPVDHLAAACGWDPERTADALDALAERLPLVGQRLARAGDRDVRIVPAGTRDDALAELAGRNIAYDGIRIDEARMLYELAGGRTPDRHKVTKIALRHMRAAGLVDYADSDDKGRTPNDLELSAATRFNLCLE